MMFERAPYLLAIALMAVPHTTAALSFSVCGEGPDGMYSDTYEVWDNGHVLVSYLPSDPNVAPSQDWMVDAKLRMIDCRSGRFVAALHKGEDISDQMETALNKVIDAEAISLNRFEKLIRKAGAKTLRARETNEICECTVHFPEFSAVNALRHRTDG